MSLDADCGRMTGNRSNANVADGGIRHNMRSPRKIAPHFLQAYSLASVPLTLVCISDQTSPPSAISCIIIFSRTAFESLKWGKSKYMALGGFITEYRFFLISFQRYGAEGPNASLSTFFISREACATPFSSVLYGMRMN
jgi:hypothetical protein